MMLVNKQKGFSLIEIMISLTLGLIVIGGALSIYISTIRSSSDTIKSAHLNYDLGMAMSLMTNDIKRAGYWGGAVIGANSMLNPFTAETSLTIGTKISANDCILYTYDADNSGALTPADQTDDVDAGEYYGFRRFKNTTTGTYTIQMRSSNVACGDTGSGWSSITDENTINIKAVQFSFESLDSADNSSPCTDTALSTCLTATSRCYNSTDGTVIPGLTCASDPAITGERLAQKRVVNILLTAELVNDTEVTKTLSFTTKVRNNRVVTVP